VTSTYAVAKAGSHMVAPPGDFTDCRSRPRISAR
jgi:hypothetical protein